ncbi:MAG: hypothetical protein VCD50_02085 [Alphaproteobacteria bacterium]|jgi:hypothetical protein
MSLHILSGPGWPAEAYSVAGWAQAATPLNVIRRPATIRAELPQPRPEGQVEKR